MKTSYSISYGLVWLITQFVLVPASATVDDNRNGVADPIVSLFQTSLMGDVQGVPSKKGSIVATLEENTLQLVGYFANLTSPWIQIDLYRDDPATAGELVKNLAITVPEGGGDRGGIAISVTLTEGEIADLLEGRLYVNVRTLGDRIEDLTGQVQSWTVDNPVLLKTDVWQIQNGTLSSRGKVQAIFEGDNLRLVGYGAFNSAINQVSLYRGSDSEQGEHLGVIWFNIGEQISLAGFDHVMPLSNEVKQHLLDGLLYLEINSFSADKARGRLLPSTNQAPSAVQIEGPASGTTLVIGGGAGDSPMDPETQLAEVVFSSASDPDGNPVTYFWQASRTEDFGAAVSAVIELGAEEGPLALTVAEVAAVFDAVWSGFPAPIPFQTPVEFYHRMITTDGAAYTYGPTASLTLVRGTITANEAENNLPAAFTLIGNYPNPFNPTTNIVFDLPWTADVRVDVFDLLGRQVLTQRPGILAAGAMRRVEIDGGALPSGSYLYRVMARNERDTRTITGSMLLVK